MILPVQIAMLGRFMVIRGEHKLTRSDWDRQKAATLLQRLALERRLLRDQVIDFLWPDASPESGANNLYQTLHTLRRFLTAKLGEGVADVLFTFHNGVLYLHSSVQVDVHEFRSLCSQIQSTNDPNQLDRLQQALDLYQGDFLPDERYAEWTIAPRESLRRLHRQATMVLASHYQEHRNYNSALALVTPLLNGDPTDEPVHRTMMHLYALDKHRHAALQQYQACAEALTRDLGVTPEQETKDLYTQILKGEILPLPANSPKPAPSLPLLSRTEKKQNSVCFGRVDEIDWLATRTYFGQHNTGRVILLSGDPGIGKTRLASEVLQCGAESGLLCLSGTAHEHEGRPSYQSFIEAFDHYLSENEQSTQLNPITSFRPAGFSDPQLDHAALLRAIGSFLTKLAAQAPVLLFLDDLHAADEASLHLFHYLARQTREIPLILFAAYRSDLVLTSPSPFSRLLNALYREQLSETLHLPPLDESATANLIAQILRGEPEPELVSSIREIAEGNPFFIREIIQTMVHTDQIVLREGRYILLSPHALAVPADLRSFLRERIERLGPVVVSVLTIGALIGREFSFTVIRYTSELTDNQVLDALDLALTSQILIETAGGYRFSHAIIRQTLYEGLSHLHRMHLHTQVAEALEQMYHQNPNKLHASIEDLAFHYNLSNRREKALPYLLQAGQKAAAVFAFEVAIHYFEQAQLLMETLDLHDPKQYLHILEQLGWWRIILADTPRAVDSFEQALALTPESGWRLRTSDYLRLHRAAARALITAGKITDAEAHLRAALEKFHDGQEDSAAGAYLFYDVALWHWHLNDYQAASEAAQRSREIAANLRNDDALARAYEALALISHSLGDWQKGYAYEMERAHLTGLGLDVTEAFDVHLCLWEYYLYGDMPYETLKQMVDTMLQQAQRMSAPRAIALCQCFGGALEFQAGHWEQAAAMLQESIRLHRQIGSAAGEALACQRLGVLLTAQGEIDKALRVLEEGILAGERAIMRAHCLTRLYAALTSNRLAFGDNATAQQALTLGMTMQDQHGYCKSCDSLLLPVAVSASIAQHDLTSAEEFFHRLDEAATHYGSQAWRAMAAKAYGELGLARKDYHQASQSFTAASRDFAAAGFAYEARQCAHMRTSTQRLE